jgi:hypothetical protein
MSEPFTRCETVLMMRMIVIENKKSKRKERWFQLEKRKVGVGRKETKGKNRGSGTHLDSLQHGEAGKQPIRFVENRLAMQWL